MVLQSRRSLESQIFSLLEQNHRVSSEYTNTTQSNNHASLQNKVLRHSSLSLKYSPGTGDKGLNTVDAQVPKRLR